MLILATDRREWGLRLSAYLNDRGIFLYLSPLETAAFLCDRKDTGGVLVDCCAAPEQGAALFMTLRTLYPEMPIGVLTSPDAVPCMGIRHLIRTGNADAAMVASVMTFCRDACGWETDGLLTAALDVGDDPIDTHYLGYGLPLSRHAHEVLRCLLYRSPCTTGAEDLMTLCLPDDLRCRDNLARQICTINSQAARIDPRPLVVSVNGSGYRLRDGIL